MPLYLLVYSLGFLLALGLLILLISGRVKVRHFRRLPFFRGRIAIVSNHPSLFEPFLLPALFAPQYLLWPKAAPWSTPDRANYYDRWRPYRIFSPRMIFVPRGNFRGELKALRRIIAVLRAKGRVIIFPEGGRTGKGDPSELLCSNNGKRLRPLKTGIGRVVWATGCTVVPIWVDGAECVLPLKARFPRLWRKTVIRIGEPLRFDAPKRPFRRAEKKLAEQRITAQITAALLALADEGN